jgi:hypothetical protein
VVRYHRRGLRGACADGGAVIPAYITIPLCIALAFVIAYGVLGVFALIDIYLINSRKDNE